jgi:hypothetical protein
MTNREFYLHKHYGIDIAQTNNVKPKQENNNVFVLEHNQTKQYLISGNYALCKWKLNQLTTYEQKFYKIKPMR